jgi:hypothetical protein
MPASAVGRYTIITSKSNARNALFNSRMVRIPPETTRRIKNAKTQSLLSSSEFGEAAKL